MYLLRNGLNVGYLELPEFKICKDTYGSVVKRRLDWLVYTGYSGILQQGVEGFNPVKHNETVSTV